MSRYPPRPATTTSSSLQPKPETGRDQSCASSSSRSLAEATAAGGWCRRTSADLAGSVESAGQRVGSEGVVYRNRPRSRDDRADGGRRSGRGRGHDPGAKAVRYLPRLARWQPGQDRAERRSGHGQCRVAAGSPWRRCRRPSSRRSTNIELVERVSLPEATLKDLIGRTAFAMAHQDVRYYLNGLLLDLREDDLALRGDGWAPAGPGRDQARSRRCRRAVRSSFRARACWNCRVCSKPARALVELEFGRNHMRVRRGDVTFTSKLIDGRFPDYEAVIPIGADKEVRVGREESASALAARGDPVEREVSWRQARGQSESLAHRRAQSRAGRSGRGARGADARCPISVSAST